MRWAGHIAHIKEMRMRTTLWWESQMGRDHVEVLGVDGKITLEWMLGK